MVLRIIILLSFLTSTAVLAQNSKPTPGTKPKAISEVKPALATKTQPSPPKPKNSPLVTTSAKQDACGDLERKEFLDISPEDYFKLIEKWQAVVLSIEPEACYLPGMTIKINTIRSENAVMSERIYRGQVNIKMVQRQSFDIAKKDHRLFLNQAQIAEYSRRINTKAKRLGQSVSHVYILTLEKPALESEYEQYGVPLFHPMADKINGKDFAAAIQAGAFVVDVRAKPLFTKNPLKGAKNLYTENYRLIVRKVLTRAEMKAAGIGFNSEILPKDKNTEIYVTSICAGEYSSYNFITLLRHAGYRNLKWFRSGALSLRPDLPGCETPASIAGVGNIKAKEIADRIADKDVVIVDARNPWKKESFRIKNAKHNEFFHMNNIMGLPNLRGNLSLASLRKEKETFEGGSDNPIGANFNDTVIVYGQNEYDWNAYKAAIMLSSVGYKNVYWYRLGFDDWKAHALINPPKFPFNKAVKKMEIYL